MTKKIKKWDKRVELARRRCASVIDFDSEPVIEYTAVKCSIALSQIDELDKLHKAELKANDKEWERRIEGMREKFIFRKECFNNNKVVRLVLEKDGRTAIYEGIEKAVNWFNQALSDLLQKGKHE